MSNRELLELAAKAAGYEVIKEFPYQIAVSCGAPNSFDGVELFGLVIHDCVKVRSPWNPLIDDGDALRLAVKLGLKLEKHEEYYPYFSAEKAPDVFIAEDVIKNGGDELAAARLAIVRAAAEIGRGM